MARTKKTFQSLSPCDQATIATLVKTVPVSAIEEAMAASSKKTLRQRKLPVELLIYYVIFLSVFTAHSTSEVLKFVLNGLTKIFPGCFSGTACESAISQGRTRLGDEVMRLLFNRVCKPLVDAGSPNPWSFFRDLRLVAIDSIDLDLPDEQAIKEEYPIANDGGNRPKLRFNALVEVGSRCIFDAEIADSLGKDVPEAKSVDALLGRLPARTLLLGDWSNPSSRSMLAVVERDSHFLFRAKDTMPLLPCENLGDGSYLATMGHNKMEGQEGSEATVRVIDYCIYARGRKIVGEGRLVTSLLDESAYPASELAMLCHECWEAEQAHDELQAYIMGGISKGLRSKTPVLVRQEFWGLLIAHYVAKKAIFEAAEASGWGLDDMSSDGKVEIIRRRAGAADCSTDGKER